MSINLKKYGDVMISAWKDVLNDKTDTDWALFGYEGQTNDLKFVNKGSSGIEEMIEDLNSGKIMYAFLRIIDPKTSLYKYVLINWQGEGANIVRKGTCANHVRDVGNFFTGAHVTINARNEEEVEPQLIIDKVAKSSGSSYSFKAPRSDNTGPSKPIGSNYQRVNPGKEINSKERDQFWLKEEQEEKKRVEDEKKRREQEKAQLESEREQREIKAAAERETQEKLRNNSIAEIRKADAFANSATSKISQERNNSITDIEQEHEERAKRSDLLRMQRNQEAQELIGKSTSNARSIFEQNTAAGQMKSKITPEKPARNKINTYNIQETKEDVKKIDISRFETNEPLTSTNNSTKRSPIHEAISKFENPKSPVSETNKISPVCEITKEMPAVHTNEFEEVKNDICTLRNNESVNRLSENKKEIPPVLHNLEPDDFAAEDQFSTIKRSPKSPNDIQTENIKNSCIDTRLVHQNTVIENANYSPVLEEQFSAVTDQQIVDEVIYQELSDDPGLRAKAMYDYQAADDTEITFDPGDIITHIDQIDEGWWQGLGPDGTFGLFPANYVELLPN